MAKEFEERAALGVDSDRARLSDLRRLVAEGGELIDQLAGTHAQATADAVDFRLNQLDRDDAEKLSVQTERRIEAVEGAMKALRDKLAECAASTKQRAIEAERAAAIAERDDLAASFKVILQPMVEALPELLAAVRDNKARLKRAGHKNVLDAELSARGLASEYPSGGPVFRFTEMRIPEWSGSGQAWPKGAIHSPGHSVYDPAKVNAKRAGIIQGYRRTWGRYRVHPAATGGRVKFTERTPSAVPDRIVGVHPEFPPIEVNIDHTEVERLRSLGLKVDRLPDEVADESLMHW